MSRFEVFTCGIDTDFNYVITKLQLCPSLDSFFDNAPLEKLIIGFQGERNR